MKAGRNDPCPCGSGKKYKQCCMKTEQPQPEEEFLWRRIRRAIEGSPMKMLDFSSSHFGRKALLEAWDDFMPWEDEPFAMDTPHMPIFMPWFFYGWLPDLDNTTVKREALDERTLGQAYLDKKRPPPRPFTRPLHRTMLRRAVQLLRCPVRPPRRWLHPARHIHQRGN